MSKSAWRTPPRLGTVSPGTEAFIARFGIQKDADGCSTLGELAAHEKIGEMLKNYQFKKVVFHVLAKNGIELA